MGKIIKCIAIILVLALIIAGIIAEGTTELTNLEHIDRGYEDIVKKLTNVGAKIKLEKID